MSADVTSARSVSWWSVHEYVQPVLTRIGDYPAAGTPAWCALADDDPRKVAAIFDYAQHHALRVEFAQEALADAATEISLSLDWRALSQELTQRRSFYAARPWLRRTTA
ncbi:MAG: DUF2742 domain-containing protein [Mycobacterium sp.]